MKRGIKSVITHEVINAVFGDPSLAKKFSHPRKDRRICEARANGDKLSAIGKRHKTSAAECGRIVRRAILLHALYVEEVMT